MHRVEVCYHYCYVLFVEYTRIMIRVAISTITIGAQRRSLGIRGLGFRGFGFKGLEIGFTVRVDVQVLSGKKLGIL